jgi:hypothetical protein
MINAIVETEHKIGPGHQVRVHIDQNLYHSPNPTTGAALYLLGQVPAGLDLYRKERGDLEDTLIENGPEVVHLREGEHFHTGPLKVFTIIVNGKQKTVASKRLSFDQLIDLAFNPRPVGPNIIFTVTYGHGPKANPEGELLQGQSVKIQDGMVFSVTPTDKS